MKNIRNPQVFFTIYLIKDRKLYFKTNSNSYSGEGTHSKHNILNTKYYIKMSKDNSIAYLLKYPLIEYINSFLVRAVNNLYSLSTLILLVSIKSIKSIKQ